MIAQAASTELPPIVNAMTVDVEDYFHVSAFEGVVPRSQWPGLESRVYRNTEQVLAILDEAGVTATFFVLGWVAERHRSLVRRIAARGHEIASHGYAHRLVYDQSPEAFRQDVGRAKHLLEDIAAVRVDGFRAPSYSITPRSLWAFDALIEAGYRYDTSVFPIRHDRYGIPVSARHMYRIDRPGGSLIEVPASATRVAGTNVPVAGGGYFRILPYGWTRWGIKRINEVEGRAATFYFHPWEIDPDQPRLVAGPLSRFRHYRNLHLTEDRLRRLLKEFRFGTVRQTIHDAECMPWPSGQTALALPYLW